MSLLAAIQAGAAITEPPPSVSVYDVSWWAAGWADDLSAVGDGNTVTTWTDGTGNSRSPTQGTSGDRPVYDADGVNGRPGVTFAGSDFLSITGLTLSQDYTIVAVVVPSNADAGVRYVGTTNTNTRGLGQSTTSTGRFIAHAGSALEGGQPVISTPTIVRGYFNAASSTVHVNGSSVASGGLGSGALDRIVLGRAGDGLSAQFGGLMAFWGIYDGLVTDDADWSAVAGELASLYGTAGA